MGNAKYDSLCSRLSIKYEILQDTNVDAFLSYAPLLRHINAPRTQPYIEPAIPQKKVVLINSFLSMKHFLIEGKAKIYRYLAPLIDE